MSCIEGSNPSVSARIQFLTTAINQTKPPKAPIHGAFAFVAPDF